ncbi:hypothetical protein AB0I68_10550 [Streptomyces sp. NPDC050448]|uniref:hypothetical protein n=1 Tax=Streptomyces sp. NPDC050448 TaxID=3155404 RepID=UPI00341250C2
MRYRPGRGRIDEENEVPAGGGFGFCPPLDTQRSLEVVRRDALCAHPLLRRGAARDRRLPPDLLSRLCADEDLGVRVLLAQNHPDASPEHLLRSFLACTGRYRAELLTRPQFPTGGLPVYADHADPAVREALARHPNLPPARLRELPGDGEPAHAAAADPALDPALMEEIFDAAG